jgi:hypothetical protein
MAKRVVLVVCGYNTHSRDIKACLALGFNDVDVSKILPRDPAQQGGGRKGDSVWLVDDVVAQRAFPDAVAAVVNAAAHGLVLVKCRAGLHRSPVVAKMAGEVQG